MAVQPLVLFLQLLLASYVFDTATALAKDDKSQKEEAIKARFSLKLPHTAKYHPQDVDEFLRQHEAAAHLGAGAAAKPVLKVFGDEGEKYYGFDYERFGQHANIDIDHDEGREYIEGEGFNRTVGYMLPIGLHIDTDQPTSAAESNNSNNAKRWLRYFGPRASRLIKRQQTSCPANSSPCTSLGKPGICCPSGTTCSNVPDTGFGIVGCCPSMSI